MNIKKEEVTVDPLFAWPLMRHQTNVPDLVNQLIAQIGLTDPYRTNAGNLVCTDMKMLDRPELTELKTAIIEAARFYAYDVLAYTNVEIELLQSWINVTEPGQYHHLHNHTNCMISGTYYPFGAQECPIIFHNPTEFQFTPSTDDTIQHPMSMISRNVVRVAPKPGEVVLWLSQLKHRVDANPLPINRYSLSFNIMLRGYHGHLGSASGVQL